MGDALKTTSGQILDRIAESLVANDHGFRMARKVERLISSAAPALQSVLFPAQFGLLNLNGVIDVEPIDREGRPAPTSTSCACLVEHSEVYDLDQRVQFPVLRIVGEPEQPIQRVESDGAECEDVAQEYAHFAHYRMVPMKGYSYDEIEADRP